MIVRPVTAADVPQVQTIYAHHVLHGTGTFEEVPPSAADIAARIAGVQAYGLPYVVVEDGGIVHAFAYAGPFRPRAAYRYTVETSVYAAPGSERRGYGRAAMTAVLSACEAFGAHQAVAVIGGFENDGSIGLHAALGYVHIGVLQGVGFKAGDWVDVVHMQKALNRGVWATPTAGQGLNLSGH